MKGTSTSKFKYGTKSGNAPQSRGSREFSIGRGFREGGCMSPILFNLYLEYLMKEELAEVGVFKIG